RFRVPTVKRIFDLPAHRVEWRGRCALDALDPDDGKGARSLETPNRPRLQAKENEGARTAHGLLPRQLKWLVRRAAHDEIAIASLDRPERSAFAELTLNLPGHRSKGIQFVRFGIGRPRKNDLSVRYDLTHALMLRAYRLLVEVSILVPSSCIRQAKLLRHVTGHPTNEGVVVS